ncbi:MAG TPA: rod shape-determining protein MreC [Bacteroidaceae bacterium]|nr:rod shape-determining protein MreC [Bacteroidaceae bacterium]
MRDLLNFLIRHSHWFLLIFLEAVCFVLLIVFSSQQKSVVLSTANVVVGSLYNLRTGVVDYFSLKSENYKLAFENAKLQAELFDFRLEAEQNSLPKTEHNIYVAKVINNSIRKDDNFITIDKGELDGIREDMGVYDSYGVVGVVYKTSNHYAVVMPLLNRKSRISCKIKGLDSFGYLEWKGGDTRFSDLLDLPYHPNVVVGDTIVTSGFSSIFPKDVSVGVVSEIKQSSDLLSYILKVRLLSDISSLRYVYVNGNIASMELIELEQIVNR